MRAHFSEIHQAPPAAFRGMVGLGLGDAGNTMIIGGAVDSPLDAGGCQAPGSDMYWAIPNTGKCYPPAAPPYLTYLQPGAFIVPIADLSGVIPQFVRDPLTGASVPTGQLITGTYVNQVPVIGPLPPVSAGGGSTSGGTTSAGSSSGSTTGTPGATTSPDLLAEIEQILKAMSAGSSSSTSTTTTQQTSAPSWTGWFTQSMIGGIPNWMLVAGVAGGLVVLSMMRKR